MSVRDDTFICVDEVDPNELVDEINRLRVQLTECKAAARLAILTELEREMDGVKIYADYYQVYENKQAYLAACENFLTLIRSKKGGA